MKFKVKKYMDEIKVKDPLLAKITSYAIVLIITVAAYFFLQFSDFLTFVAFIILAPIFVYLGFDGKVPVVFSVIMFVMAAITLSTSANPTSIGIAAANVFAIYAFWLLVVGIICLIIEHRRERRSGWPTLNEIA